MIAVLAEKFHIFFVLFRYTHYNPHAVGNKEHQMEKFKTEKKTEEELESIKVACENNGIDFEHRGTFWEGNEGVVLFNLQSVWWLQKNPKNPYNNTSYNAVPPTAELTLEKKGRSWVYFVGTSITNQALDLKELERRTGVEVKLDKCFTISTKHATYKPDCNVKDVALERARRQEFDWIVIEVGVNEVSNLNLRKSESENDQIIEDSVKELIAIAEKLTKMQPGVKVVLLKQVERFDSAQKNGWRVKMNTLLEENVKKGKVKDICVKDLSLPTKHLKQKIELFGDRAQQGRPDLGKVDNLHLRGAKAKQIFTESAVRLVNALKGGRSRSKVKLPRVQSNSRRPLGNMCTFSLPPSHFLPPSLP